MPPRTSPHPFALFSLEPYGPPAEAVVAHPRNSHLISTGYRGEMVLDVGFHLGSESPDTLATLGRGNTDIFMAGLNISKLQCSFEINLDSNAIMLYDRSHGHTTEVFGEDAIPFDHGRPRKIVVQKGLNEMIRMGGVGPNSVQFKLRWHQNAAQTIEKVKHQRDYPCTREEDSRLARTAPCSRGEVTRKAEMRYRPTGSSLGSGEFGDVHKVVDVDSGKLMAVKILKKSVARSLKEIQVLSRLKHPHIVDYIGSQGDDGTTVQIFMGLKEGNLETLLTGTRELSFLETVLFKTQEIPRLVFEHMLRALDYLASKDIVHRDVKPANILYTIQPDGQLLFQLGDFGLCNRVTRATSYAGSPLYMAPEVRLGVRQTPKVDVWSLFVTMLWTLNPNNFRKRSETFDNVQEAILWAASNEKNLSSISKMAARDPVDRASAAQMLIKHFEGVGLSTPRSAVPALISNSADGSTGEIPASGPVPDPASDPAPGSAPAEASASGPSPVRSGSRSGFSFRSGSSSSSTSRSKPKFKVT